jgi:hypothetical protein
LITFSYTPVNGKADTLALLDSDRFWPAEFSHGAQGAVQSAHPIRSQNQTHFGRGNIVVPITFSCRRQFTTLGFAYEHAFIKIPALCGAKGTLTIDIPTGGRVRSVGCVCQSAPSRLEGVGVWTTFTFIGQRPVP